MARQQRTASRHAVSGVPFSGPLVGMPPLACLSADRWPTRRHRHCHKGPYAARWLNAAGGVPLAVRDGSATWVCMQSTSNFL